MPRIATVNQQQTVFDKLGRPTDIPAFETLTPGMLPDAIEQLQRRLVRHGIYLSTVSPNIRDADLYRFMSGAFLSVQLTRAESPALHCFVYDDFHPDPFHENEQIALDYCIRLILQKKNLLHMFPPGRPLRLNQHRALQEQSFRQVVHAFKSRYEEIIPIQAQALKTMIRGDHCIVSGKHSTGLCSPTDCRLSKGKWWVEFRQEPGEDWRIINVQIEDIPL